MSSSRAFAYARFFRPLAFVGVLFSSTLLGCGGSGHSRIASGDSYSSGVEEFDGFFQSTRDIKFRAEEAASDEALQKKLAKAVGLKDDAPRDALLTAARERSDALKKSGGKFFVVVAPKPELVVKHLDSRAAADFAKAIEEIIRLGIERADQLEGVVKEVAAIEGQLKGLRAEVSSKFEAERRAEVEAELDGAQEVLTRARLEAEGGAGRSLRLVVLLASAVDSGAAAELLAVEAGTSAKTPKTWKGGGKGAKGGGGGKAAPKPKSKPKQDFDP